MVIIAAVEESLLTVIALISSVPSAVVPCNVILSPSAGAVVNVTVFAV